MVEDQSDDESLELKKNMLMRYILSQVFGQTDSPQEVQQVPAPIIQLPPSIPQMEAKAAPTRFKALREKMSQNEESNTEVNNAT